MRLRICYAMWGTEVGYATTRRARSYPSTLAPSSAASHTLSDDAEIKEGKEPCRFSAVSEWNAAERDFGARAREE
eukprot:493960-Rhodomonas_salina.2